MRYGSNFFLQPMRFQGFTQVQPEKAPHQRSCWRRSLPARGLDMLSSSHQSYSCCLMPSDEFTSSMRYKQLPNVTSAPTANTLTCFWVDLAFVYNHYSTKLTSYRLLVVVICLLISLFHCGYNLIVISLCSFDLHK